jgi:ferredoxin
VRLDLFLPFLRRPKPGLKEPGLFYRAARALTPKFLRSDRARHHSSPIRKFLRFLGEGWLSSPLRRVVQTVCFIGFLILFFWVCWPYGGSGHYAEELAGREAVDAEIFLALDPLLSISTAIAAKTWIWSLAFAGLILLFGVVFPRGFCGYLCPLGTLIDLFDWAIGKRMTRFEVKKDGWWVNLKYYILLGTLVAAMFGVLLTGFVAAIPVVTRGLLFTVAPLVSGLSRGWYLVPPMNWGHVVSIALFFVVLGLGFFRPRFWCKYVCPTGAVFSVFNVFRAVERKVESTCVSCNRCVEVCPFDAIKPDFTTRTADCTLCQTCGGVCPTHAIKFVDRLENSNLKCEEATNEIALSRRGFLVGTMCGVATVPLINLEAKAVPIRPPGSVPEPEFQQMCIRCGECFKACPNDVLQPMGFSDGFNNLWTPEAVPNWSGCEPSCNNCGQVCPTGAIRALPIEEKRVARMGLAIINEKTCLPYAEREACQMCVDECNAAGYHAIEFVRVGVQVDDQGMPIPDTGFLAPVMIPEKCVGCGLCQTRCHGINVDQKHLLSETAIWVEAGEGKEDRLMKGSYLALRQEEERRRRAEQERLKKESGASDEYLPDFLKEKK